MVSSSHSQDSWIPNLFKFLNETLGERKDLQSMTEDQKRDYYKKIDESLTVLERFMLAVADYNPKFPKNPENHAKLIAECTKLVSRN